MKLVVLTPDQEVFNGTVDSVKVPGTAGPFEILTGHAAIVSSLAHGDVKIKSTSGELITFSIEKGFVEVLNNEVNLLVQGYQRA